ncbi:multicopper oxidase family protein [Glycomyces niveus]|uniref:Multicopper oxidase family protein n=1 Tax=Glycomyces niveus TaxID=2820287 RepID=A0ABS3U153_9ACTN|nr:multicopper oxidase family protein [Glycomyces sp. NEAU-S30]MBO3731478.1 multicopper oxidase family protein [Glycomyces sp. NEAU-S30]
MSLSRRAKTLTALAATAIVLAPVAWIWQASLLPESYSIADMGRHDHGGHTGTDDASTVPVDALTVPDDREADVRATLTAARGTITLDSGRTVDGYTLNGTSPGPEIRAEQGQLVEVVLENSNVDEGVTLHWHGVDVPGAMDGAAGVTQDAVAPGDDFVYRFIADQVGTFWYHSHQVSHEQVFGGLLGPLVVTPAEGAAAADVDVVVLAHLYDGRRTVNGRDGTDHVDAPAGSTVRVRVVNTDFGVMPVWVDGAPFRVAAVDGTELHEPQQVEDVAVEVPAGGRGDLEFTVPPGGGVRVNLSASTALLVGDAPVEASIPPTETLDLLHYGTSAPIGFDPGDADREFEFGIDRRPGFLDGKPGFWWTVNGELVPEVPMFTVAYGDIVTMRIANDSGEAHPMHLHGHHAVVLSRDGVAATGSPWWVDSLEVRDGEVYEIAFAADNPGIWMDHCHNLPHAAEGLVAHLAYEGVSEPFLIGGPAGNRPE